MTDSQREGGVDVEANRRIASRGKYDRINGTVGISTLITTPTAFKGVIQNSIHSNVGAAIELRDAVVVAANRATNAARDRVTHLRPATGSRRSRIVTRVATPGGWTRR